MHDHLLQSLSIMKAKFQFDGLEIESIIDDLCDLERMATLI